MTKCIQILFLCGLLASSAGCQLVGIPSYRADGPSPGHVGYASETACSDYDYAADDQCPTGILPPLPGFLAAWKEKKDLPAPPAYPRFQPIPTRPMFSSRPQTPIWDLQSGDAASSYGGLPTTQAW